MIAIAFAVSVSLIHIIIFYLESLAWGRASTNKLFGVSPDEAKVMGMMAFNQGFYNLFLALAILAGILLRFIGRNDYGTAFIDYACISVLGAGLVLFFSRPKLIRAAMIQALPSMAYLGFRFLGY